MQLGRSEEKSDAKGGKVERLRSEAAELNEDIIIHRIDKWF